MRNSQNKLNNFPLHIGSSSILLIFIVLCLISFATLSIVSARADAKLSNRVMNRTTAYYQACSIAYEELAQLDAILQLAYKNSSSEDAYYDQVAKETSLVIELSDLQSLSVTIVHLYPKKNNDPFYEIASWQVITSNELEYNTGLPILP